MSDDTFTEKFLFACIGVWLIAIVIWLAEVSHMAHEYEARITALEQSQCSIKQERQHADYKLNVCIAQLRSKP